MITRLCWVSRTNTIFHLNRGKLVRKILNERKWKHSAGRNKSIKRCLSLKTADDISSTTSGDLSSVFLSQSLRLELKQIVVKDLILAIAHKLKCNQLTTTSADLMPRFMTSFEELPVVSLHHRAREIRHDAQKNFRWTRTSRESIFVQLERKILGREYFRFTSVDFIILQ